MGNSILYVSLLCSSVSFSLPGDQEVGRKARCLGRVRLTLEDFLSVQVNKELSHAFL